MAIKHRQKNLNQHMAIKHRQKKYKPTYGYHTQAIKTNLTQHIVIIHRQQQPF